MPISKFKKKLQRKKKLDQMVDHARFWKFLVTELGVEDDSRIAIMRLEKDKQMQQMNNNNNNNNMLESKYNEDSSSSSSDDDLQRVETQEFETNGQRSDGKLMSNNNNNKRKKSSAKNKNDDFKKRKLTNYERSNRVFDLMENQNGLWKVAFFFYLSIFLSFLYIID